MIFMFTISAIIVLPIIIEGASIAVASKNTLDWNHLISKRAAGKVTENVETKNENITNIKPIDINEREHQQSNDNYGEDRTIDWQLLDGKAEDLNEEMTERRRRRSVVATRVANKLASVDRIDEENRLRSKRDLYRIDNDDNVVDDDGDDVELTQNDLENLENLIRKIQEINEENQHQDDDIDADDLAFGDDGTTYYEPTDDDDDADEDHLPLVVQMVQANNNDDDDDDDDVEDTVPYSAQKDKRSYPILSELVQSDGADDVNPTEDVWVSPTFDDNQDIDDDSENSDSIDEEESRPVYFVDADDDEESRQIRLETLKRRIKELAQYINDNYRRR